MPLPVPTKSTVRSIGGKCALSRARQAKCVNQSLTFVSGSDMVAHTIYNINKKVTSRDKTRLTSEEQGKCFRGRVQFLTGSPARTGTDPGKRIVGGTDRIELSLSFVVASAEPTNVCMLETQSPPPN
ncbi:unnamed protein product [Caretta caretta]